MLLKKRKQNWLDPFVKEISKFPSINRLQGNSKATTLLLAPNPHKEDVANNLCWSGPSAIWFFDAIAGECECASDSFVVLPLTFTGNRPVAAEVAMSVAIFKAAAENPAITKCVCVGSDAFKTYFGHGRKANMKTVACGNTLLVPDFNFKPLFAFPDVEPLNFEQPGGYVRLTRDQWMAVRAKENTVKQIMSILPAFKTFLNT